MSFALNFNAQQHAPSVGGGNYEVLPEGRYNFVVSDGIQSGTASNDGSGKLELTLTIIDGALAGKTMKWNLNLWNSNPQAAQIAQGELSALCHAIGRFQIGPVTDLYNAPFAADVGTRELPAREAGKPPLKFNTVKALYTMQGQPVGAKAGSGATAPQTAQPAAPAPAAAPVTQPGWGGAPQPAAAPAAAPAWGGAAPGGPATPPAWGAPR